MTGVAGKKYPAARVAVCDEAMRDPQIGADDLHRQIPQTGATPDEIGSIDRSRIDVVG